jgi:hypothetical protein
LLLWAKIRIISEIGKNKMKKERKCGELFGD